MLKLHSLPGIVDKPKKRVGRGRSSGKGKTSGRGMKGQRARSKVRIGFEGGQTSLIRRLPLLRGQGFRGREPDYEIVNVGRLNGAFRSGSKITIKTLIEKNLVSKKAKKVKILGAGKLEKKFQFVGKFRFSKHAKEKIENITQQSV